MAITFQKTDRVILITSPQVAVTLQDLINAIRDYEDNQENMDIPKIANATGKQTIGTGVYVGITLELLDNWRIQFEARVGPDYTICRVNGGNLVATNIYDDEPMKPSAFTYVYVELSTSAALVDGSGGSTPAEIADAVWDEQLSGHQTSGSAGSYVITSNSNILTVKKIETGRWRIANSRMVLYDSNGTTPLITFQLKTKTGGNVTVEDGVPAERVPI